MHGFIQNFTNIEKGVKCRGKKNYLPKVLESTISKPRSISNYFSTRSLTLLTLTHFKN